VVESGDVLTKFKENYRLGNRNSNSIDTLINVSAHYKQMLAEDGGAKSRPHNLTTGQVADMITARLRDAEHPGQGRAGHVERYHEADERTVLKKMARAAVGMRAPRWRGSRRLNSAACFWGRHASL